MADVDYTPAQAAAATGLSVAAVHKAIDTRLLKPRLSKGRTPRRLLSREQIVYLQLEADGVSLLPLQTRREVAKAVQQAPQADEVRVGDSQALVVKVKNARRKVRAGLERIGRAARMVVRDPQIMRGTPVYRGTRIPIRFVAEMLSHGASVEEVLAGYPSLDRTKVELAPVYARAFPQRGRPSRRAWAKVQAKRVTSHRKNGSR